MREVVFVVIDLLLAGTLPGHSLSRYQPSF
jgi:hypothetical protein